MPEALGGRPVLEQESFVVVWASGRHEAAESLTAARRAVQIAKALRSRNVFPARIYRRQPGISPPGELSEEHTLGQV